MPLNMVIPAAVIVSCFKRPSPPVEESVRSSIKTMQVASIAGLLHAFGELFDGRKRYSRVGLPVKDDRRREIGSDMMNRRDSFVVDSQPGLQFCEAGGFGLGKTDTFQWSEQDGGIVQSHGIWNGADLAIFGGGEGTQMPLVRAGWPRAVPRW